VLDSIDDAQSNVVVASTTPIGLHLSRTVWNVGTNSISHSYPDTVLFSFGPQSTIQTTLHSAYSSLNEKWLSVPYSRDTSILFQGERYDGLSSKNVSVFLSRLGWFYSLRASQGGSCCTMGADPHTWSMTLLAATKIDASVPLSECGAFNAAQDGRLLRISIYKFDSERDLTLLDPLGRPVRSWQLTASDGPREITLNVADVPSGVYFLRLSGNGVDEVRRVAIVH
jgi:hypothetical protein